ncbi:hypothetical protein PT285_11040 [Lactobacillus sp. ESL0791]|uniref:hypothetical protein n=1 Tax=Lactobacillus sp. ESL0791 TaxID=2983234 RepID=UPI0023F9FA42|nr:hypothetical protein [Lactobacillus sp. ESL0791]MDF7639936.1 hypothetical protein [Lactobacillus sp. ESL0791]
MSDDLLGSIDINNDDFEKKSPFAKKEGAKPVRIRESQYEKIRLMAFKQNKKMVDVIDELLQRAISEEESGNK